VDQAAGRQSGQLGVGGDHHGGGRVRLGPGMKSTVFPGSTDDSPILY
jgi:hypothetical protein